MKLPGLGASPPKTPDITPHASKPDAKPTPDAGKPSNTPTDSGNGGSRATGNFSNVAQGTGALASGGSAIYRADQSTQNSQYATQSTTGAVNYGGPAGSGGPSVLQSQSLAQQSPGLGNGGEQSTQNSPLLQLLDKLIGALLQPFSRAASSEAAGGHSAAGGDSARTQTRDAPVAEKGSDKSGLTSAAGEVGKALWMVPGLSNVLTGIGDSDGSIGGMIKGGVEGAVDTAKGAAEGMIRGGGNPAAMLAGAYAGALSESKAAPEEVRNIAGML
ncbi:hypothetical protein [Pseudomonas petrae]|uniref:Uncharacterized protein n=1 Tax=Pseudomonas petrae TaxID=2912190 RepID=A0ABS9I582_9PSED|nr:hypothetical protein [Pseudomonas petrae]MCF7530716.1 hypothetical protein [Pseudomonas petrae]MCF7536388.1 hypothetical protein [Pseudomonas petrae]MCF7542930.1 hypothetical protein [Pseudomonas petrae]MCF7554067.1 hypothetical protein [Pseudomonas petrae]